MFQDNPLLAQLKQKMEESKPRIEGSVKAHEKGFGFLECDNNKSYFITPPAMRKLVHGDKIEAVVESNGDKEQAVPKTLIESKLIRFIAQVNVGKNNKLTLNVDHPNINFPIEARQHSSVTETLKSGDWVVASLIQHPLKDNKPFLARITKFICEQSDQYAPWWITLEKHEQPRTPVAGLDHYEFDDTLPRQELTELDFVTIDSESTEDMDDALYIEAVNNEQGEQTGWRLLVAIADPTAYIPVESSIETDARQRCFTNYLPGFNIPMLPRELSDDLCSLKPNERRPALVCDIVTDLEGNLCQSPTFIGAWISSSYKLAYDKVSDYLENNTKNNDAAEYWKPENANIDSQIQSLHQFALQRQAWREKNALIYQDRPDYSFELNEDGSIAEIHVKYKRIANLIVEECMIIANTCCAQYMSEQQLPGIFNAHKGFDSKKIQAAHDILVANLATEENRTEVEAQYSTENLASLAGYVATQRTIHQQPDNYLLYRLRRLLSPAEFKTVSEPHFGLGLEQYATWTSPIRKYSDMVNHRLIKSSILNQQGHAPEDSVLQRLQEARKQNRYVEYDIADWLYAMYFAQKSGQEYRFSGEIQDVSRGGLRVRLDDSGASVFVPISTLHDNRKEIEVNAQELKLYIKDECTFSLGQHVELYISDVNLVTRSIIGQLIVADMSEVVDNEL